MKIVKFTMEDKDIAELFGRQNFGTKESAVLELVKNSYDSNSNKCIIEIKQTNEENYMTVKDFGCGMNSEDIENQWMHVGKSNKGYKNSSDRVLSGSKGVGRFALARLANTIEVISKKNNCNAIRWCTNWEESSLDSLNNIADLGTSLVLKDLRDTWKARDIDKLVEFLSRSYFCEKMEIEIRFNEETKFIPLLFSNLSFGNNYVSKMSLEYKSSTCTLDLTVNSDEFKAEVKPLVNPIDINFFNKKIDILQEINLKKNSTEASFFREIGDFSAMLYFALEGYSTEENNKFFYKHKTIPSSLDKGIILYRNAFSIYSFDGKRDWLEIGVKSRKSPAAATHPTGAWRVRQNQLTGYVQVDKEINKKLEDLANRQGLNENEYYDSFKKTIEVGIKEFERYRQSIIRAIVKESAHNENEEKQNTQKINKKAVNTFLKNPVKAKHMSDEDLEDLKKGVEGLQEDVSKSLAKEQQYKYDVRILNILATQGLKTGIMAHEIHADRNKLSDGANSVREALIEFGYWDDLNSDSKREFISTDIPSILSELERINKKLAVFLDSVLKKNEKKSFTSPIISLEDSLNVIGTQWCKDYSTLSVNISAKTPEKEKYKITKDVLDVLFDNLILNSIQSNQNISELKININFSVIGDEIQFYYSDNGCGLVDKYNNDPFKILEVHETSREDGHGLGMWIISNTLQMYKGNVTNIMGTKRFEIHFNLKG